MRNSRPGYAKQGLRPQGACINRCWGAAESTNRQRRRSRGQGLPSSGAQRRRGHSPRSPREPSCTRRSCTEPLPAIPHQMQNPRIRPTTGGRGLFAVFGLSGLYRVGLAPHTELATTFSIILQGGTQFTRQGEENIFLRGLDLFDGAVAVTRRAGNQHLPNRTSGTTRRSGPRLPHLRTRIRRPGVAKSTLGTLSAPYSRLLPSGHGFEFAEPPPMTRSARSNLIDSAHAVGDCVTKVSSGRILQGREALTQTRHGFRVSSTDKVVCKIPHNLLGVADVT